jgi:threonine aldolase
MALNLFSDTQTVPTPDLLRAMIEAEVGDEQRGTDPTVITLEKRVATLLGQEASVFLPSGTMCNAIAVRLHVRPGGDEIILHAFAHAAESECGSPAALSGASLHLLQTPTGIYGPDAVEAAIRPPSRYMPRSRLLIVEQTTNLGGGRIWPAETIDAVVATARAHGPRVHLDGARLMNAVVAASVPAERFAAGFDTAWIDFAKGLGCPFGAVLAGSQELIEEAWRYKQMWGGAMRQSGYLAAACLYALDHNVDRLAEDHANAKLLATGLAEIPGIEIDPNDVETNIVIFGVGDARRVSAALAAQGLDLPQVDARRLRAVTFLGVTQPDIEKALDLIAAAVGST